MTKIMAAGGFFSIFAPSLAATPIYVYRLLAYLLQILVDHSKILNNHPRCRGAGNRWFMFI